MPRVSKLINDNIVAYAENQLKKMGNHAMLARKLEAIIAASKHGIKAVAKIYDISRTTLTEWIKHIGEENLSKLKAPEERKRNSILNDSDRSEIKKWIDENPQITIKAIVIKLSEELGKSVSKSTAHREVKNLRYSYITPRKQHTKQDPELVNEFKKKYSK